MNGLVYWGHTVSGPSGQRPPGEGIERSRCSRDGVQAVAAPCLNMNVFRVSFADRQMAIVGLQYVAKIVVVDGEEPGGPAKRNRLRNDTRVTRPSAALLNTFV